MKRPSLTLRITLLMGLAIVVLVGGAALAMDRMVDGAVSARMDAALLAQAQTLASLARIGPAGLEMQSLAPPRSHLNAGRTTEFWAVDCADGSHASSQPASPALPARWQASAKTMPTFANLPATKQSLRAVWLRFPAEREGATMQAGDAPAAVACAVVFIHSRDAVRDILSAIDGILLLTPVLALLAVLLLSPVLVRHGLRPLTALGEAMRNIGPRAPQRRLDVAGTRELEPLVTRFNEVLARMDEGMARERQFTGALAHETRTHLTELRSLVEVEQRYPSGRSQDEMLAEIGSIVGELQGTVAGLLLLTRLEAGIEGMRPDRISVRKTVDRRIESAAERIRQRHLQLDRVDADADTTLTTDHALLDVIIGNLVNNAVAYAPAGSRIGIHHTAHKLVIANDAPDLDTSEVARFGQRFWSKHHGTEGHAGLGLALAGAAAAALHFELHFDLDANQRLHATLSWPDTPLPVLLAGPETLNDPRH